MTVNTDFLYRLIQKTTNDCHESASSKLQVHLCLDGKLSGCVGSTVEVVWFFFTHSIYG